MEDQGEIVRHSRRFIKGVKRAFFSPIEPEDIEVTPTSPNPPSDQNPAPPPAPPQPVSSAPPQPSPQPAAPTPTPEVSARPPSVRSVVEEAFRERTIAAAHPPPPPRKKRSIKPILFLLVILLLGGAAFYSFRMYWQSREELTRLQLTSAQTSEQEANEIIARVRKHMMLPNETPIVTTVTDVASVRGQPFYANALNGDRVLVFTKRAILYRPSIDRIIEVGYILPASSIGTEATGSAQNLGSPSGKVIINNGKK